MEGVFLMAYADWLDAIVKSEPVYIIEFSGIATRFVTKDFDGLSSAASPYADVDLASTHHVKITKAQADAGSASFDLVDVEEEVHAFLNTNEKYLKDILAFIIGVNHWC